LVKSLASNCWVAPVVKSPEPGLTVIDVRVWLTSTVTWLVVVKPLGSQRGQQRIVPALAEGCGGIRAAFVAVGDCHAAGGVPVVVAQVYFKDAARGVGLGEPRRGVCR